MSAIERECSEQFQRFCGGKFQFQKAPSVITAYYYLILFNKKTLDTQQIESSAVPLSDCVERLNVTLTCWSLSHFHAAGRGEGVFY